MSSFNTFDIIKSIEVILLIVPALIMDIKSMKIKNHLTFPIMIAGILTNSIMYGFSGLFSSLIGILVSAGILTVVYIPRYIGAGDVKFFSAIGAVMQTQFTIKCILAAFLIGGIAGCVFLLLKRKRFPFMIAAAPAVLLMLLFINNNLFDWSISK